MNSNISHTCHLRFARTLTACLLAFVGLAPGCSGKPPTTPTPVPTPRPTPRPFAAPVVKAVSENVGSIGGGAEVKIEGTGFLGGEGGPVVTFGGVHALTVYWVNATDIIVTAPPHPAGLVDIVVINDDGQSAGLADAYTYVSPESFDPNGEWEGWAVIGQRQLRFTIQDGKVTAVSCDTSGTRNFSPAPSVSNGEFEFSLDGKFIIAGRLVSPRDAIGFIDLAPCSNTTWFVKKQS